MHRTSIECWQKNLNFQKGQEILDIAGLEQKKKKRETEKRNQDKTNIPKREL